MRTRRLLITLPTLVGLLLAGCSDDSTPTPATAPTSASASPSASPSAESSVDAAIAAKVNLTAADVGAGWLATPADPASPTDDTVERTLYSCIGVTPTDPIGDDVSSPSFASAQGAQISSSVDVYADESVAKSEFAAFSSAKALGCLQKSIQTLLTTQVSQSGGVLASAALDRRKELEVVPESIGFRFTAKITVSGQSSTVSGDVVAIRRGRIGVQVTSFSIGPPFPGEVLSNAIKAVAARAGAQTG